MTDPQITIVICTYNREDMLAHCLGSLVQQGASGWLFDVLVIDNNSSDGTLEVVTGFQDKLPRLRYVFEPQQGLAYARNRALAEADTEWIAYLDDDAIVRPDWLQVMGEVIDSDLFDCFGGVYLPWHYFRERPEWFDENWGTNKCVQAEMGPLNENAHISGGNCAMKRSLAIEHGGFPVNVGMSGGRISYGEETQLFNRMKSAGVRLGFVPHMLMDHCVMPYKYSAIWHVKSAFASGRDNYSPPSGKARFHVLAHMCLRAIKALAAGLIAALKNLQASQKIPWKRLYIEKAKAVAVALGMAYACVSKPAEPSGAQMLRQP